MSREILNRLRVGEDIVLLPGIHLRRLARLLGLQLSTTTYHVSRLEKDGKILCSRDGEYLRSFPLSVTDESERQTYALLQHKAARQILKLIVKESSRGVGVANGELSVRLGLSGSTVSKYVGAMRELGLVNKLPAKGGRWVLEVGAEGRAKLTGMVSSLDENFLSVVSDSYVDLWGF